MLGLVAFKAAVVGLRGNPAQGQVNLQILSWYEMRPTFVLAFVSLLLLSLHWTWFQGTVPRMAAMKTSAVSAMSGSVKHKGLEGN